MINICSLRNFVKPLKKPVSYPEVNPSGFFMQDRETQKSTGNEIDFKSFSVNEQQKLVGVFVWLIEQDKKQNPANYQKNNKVNYD